MRNSSSASAVSRRPSPLWAGHPPKQASTRWRSFGRRPSLAPGALTERSPGAADLKFLQHLQETQAGTSNRKAALKSKLASAPWLPKFVPESAAAYHELRKRGTSWLFL